MDCYYTIAIHIKYFKFDLVNMNQNKHGNYWIFSIKNNDLS